MPRSYVVSSSAAPTPALAWSLKTPKCPAATAPAPHSETATSPHAASRFTAAKTVSTLTSVTIEDSYIHDLWAGGDAHTDGIQIAIGDDVTIRHNRIEAGTNGTSAIISPSSGTNNVTVDRNLSERRRRYPLLPPKGRR